MPLVTAPNLYEVPLVLERLGLGDYILERIGETARRKPDWEEWERFVANAKRFAQVLQEAGYRLVTGGTDNHLVLVDLGGTGLKGNTAEALLEKTGVLANKNVVPYDTESPMITSGLRFGTPALTTRGMKEAEMEHLGNIVHRALSYPENEAAHIELQREVQTLCKAFPLYQELGKGN